MIAGHQLADCLATLGVRHIYGVPGESYLPLLDALPDHGDLQFVTCRGEGGAAFMACADARLRGRPALLAVTRGPGATNASIGVHTAMQDALPMIVLVGLSERATRGRRAFQEIDVTSMFASLAKAAYVVEDASRLEEWTLRAWREASASRQGPVVLGLPEDMLYDSCAAPSRVAPRAVVSRIPVDASALAHEATLAGERTLIVVGGSDWDQHSADALAQFTLPLGIGVATAFRCQDYYDNTLPNYIGDVGIGISPALAKGLAEADLVIALGACLDDPTTGAYERRLGRRLIQVVADVAEYQGCYGGDLIVSDPRDLCQALANIGSRSARRIAHPLNAGYDNLRMSSPPGSVDVASAMRLLSERLPNAIVANGSGNYAALARKHFQFRRFGGQLAPRSGAMGYGVPAAIAASRLQPQTPVVSLNGDGCFLMNANELATLADFAAPLLFLVINNHKYGTIETHQQMHFSGRAPVGIQLQNPDFSAYGRAFGLHAASVRTTEELLAAVHTWLAEPRATLLDVITA
jgi:acetolactate synthase-1/2/3 large subunit